MSVPSPTRMNAEDRRQLVLDAATRAFARGGFAGTSTDAVAKEAGVSQPYVVRIFGTKQELFLEAFERAVGRVVDAFEAVLSEPGFDPDDEASTERLGAAYTDLLTDRDLMLVVMHGFAAGDIEAIGQAGRHGMGRIFGLLVEHGMTPEAARDFIAHGMLLNVLMAMRLPDHAAALEEAGAGDLSLLATCTFGEHLAKARAPRDPA